MSQNLTKNEMLSFIIKAQHELANTCDGITESCGLLDNSQPLSVKTGSVRTDVEWISSIFHLAISYIKLLYFAKQ